MHVLAYMRCVSIAWPPEFLHLKLTRDQPCEVSTKDSKTPEVTIAGTHLCRAYLSQRFP